MTGFVRKATLLSACGLLAAATAMASVPSPATSTCPGCGGAGSSAAFIPYVGFVSTASNAAHSGTAFTVTIRDFAGNPVAGSVVQLNSSACTDLVLCENLPGAPAAQTVQCNNFVRGTTNALGQVTLQPIGGGTNNGSGSPNAGAGLNCVQITADGIPLSSATAVIFDENGFVSAPTGVSASDLSSVRRDVAFAATYRGRSDFSFRDGCGGAGDCGTISAADIAYFRAVLKESTVAPISGSGSGCASNVPSNYCP